MNLSHLKRLWPLYSGLLLGYVWQSVFGLQSSQSRRGERVADALRATEFRIVDDTGESNLTLGFSEGPLFHFAKKGALVQMGVHADGSPMILVSDKAVRNFGLGRVDGKYKSPILVFRTNDDVRSLVGLSMVDKDQEPFWSHWSAQGKKQDFLGSYR